MHYSELAYEAVDSYLNLSPEECLRRMFDSTDKNGIMCIPSWPYDDLPGQNTGRGYKCHMQWNAVDCEVLIRRFSELNAFIVKFAKEYGSGSKNYSSVNSRPNYTRYLPLWNTYLKPYSRYDGFAIKQLESESRALVAIGNPLINSRDTNTICKESENRLQNKYKAYDVISRARRLFRLIEINAPRTLVDNEARFLAEAMAINSYCSGIDVERIKRFRFDA